MSFKTSNTKIYIKENSTKFKKKKKRKQELMMLNDQMLMMLMMISQTIKNRASIAVFIYLEPEHNHTIQSQLHNRALNHLHDDYSRFPRARPFSTGLRTCAAKFGYSPTFSLARISKLLQALPIFVPVHRLAYIPMAPFVQCDKHLRADHRVYSPTSSTPVCIKVKASKERSAEGWTTGCSMPGKTYSPSYCAALGANSLHARFISPGKLASNSVLPLDQDVITLGEYSRG